MSKYLAVQVSSLHQFTEKQSNLNTESRTKRIFHTPCVTILPLQSSCIYRQDIVGFTFINNNNN